MSRSSMVKRESTKKGLVAGAAGVGTAVLLVSGWTFFGVVGLAGTGYLTYKWLAHRGKWGMRF